MSDSRKAVLVELFPNLSLNDFEITSPVDFDYNCFGWAAGDNSVFMQPSRHTRYCWITDRFGDDLENFIEQFRYFGYEVAGVDHSLEPGYEKIVFYAKDSAVTHASRQLADGWWTSKLGQSEDIRYRTLSGLAGDEYGEPVLIMKRKTKG